MSPGETKRIYTIGIYDIENNQENLFFPLDNVREKGYIYSISKGEASNGKRSAQTDRSQMKEKLSDENMSISFGVFPTTITRIMGT